MKYYTIENIMNEIIPFHMYEGDFVLEQLDVEESLVLIREAGNKYDQYAVKIHRETGYMLGYISAVYSEFIANVIDQQLKYEVRISRKYLDAIPQMKIWIEIKGEYTFQDFKNEYMQNRTRELFFANHF